MTELRAYPNLRPSMSRPSVFARSDDAPHPRTRQSLGRALCAAMLLGGCVQARQIYPLTLAEPHRDAARGSVQIERIEGHQRLLALRFERLAPPEQWGAEYTAFVAWVQDSHGRTVKMGPLRYDRALRSARLLGAVRAARHGEHDDEGIDFRAFAVRVTAEREGGVKVPSRVLVGEGRVMNQ